MVFVKLKKVKVRVVVLFSDIIEICEQTIFFNLGC